MFTDTNECTVNGLSNTNEFEEVLAKSINDFEFPLLQVIDARSGLTAILDATYGDADGVGNKSIAKMQEILSDFKTWRNEKRQQRHVKNDNTYVPMIQDSHNETATCIYNTDHMP